MIGSDDRATVTGTAAEEGCCVITLNGYVLANIGVGNATRNVSGNLTDHNCEGIAGIMLGICLVDSEILNREAVADRGDETTAAYTGNTRGVGAGLVVETVDGVSVSVEVTCQLT